VLLAGDIGGTKSLLGLFRRVGGRLRASREQKFASQEFPSLAAIIDRFLDGERIDGAAFGVAGPVVDGRSHVVNLRWPVDAKALTRRLGLRVQVINDVEATGWGIPELPPARFATLTPGVKAGRGNAALIAAGTGLGMSLLVVDGARFRPQSSEGGHQEFGPRTELEIELLRFLRRRHGRVSIERVVSGAGISAVYQYLIEAGLGRESAAMTRRLSEASDTNAAISAAALAGEDPVAGQAMEIFVSAYGSAAGDLALVGRALGGVYLGGGIAPKILPLLRQGGFVAAFRDKGRLRPLVERIPVRVVLEPRTALIGAAVCAENDRRPRASKRG
jgi:glucokinase